MKFFPLKVALERAKAAIIEMNIYTAVVASVINRLLKIYLENGTLSDEIRLGKTVKLAIVGLRTKNLGGKISSSSSGLNAVQMQ